MNRERVDTRKPPPWFVEVNRAGIMPASEAVAILAAMGEDIQIPNGQIRMSWEAQEHLYQAYRDMTWRDVRMQFPGDGPPHGRITDPEINRAFHHRSWIGEDLEVADSVTISPGNMKPTPIPVMLTAANLPEGLYYPESQLSEDYGIAHLGTRSRHAQARLEITDCKVTDEMYRKLKSGESLIATAHAFNYGNRPFFLEKGTHPAGYYSYEGIPRLTGRDLVKAVEHGSIKLNGTFGIDWEWIFHPSWPRNFLNIVGVRGLVENFQMERLDDKSKSAISIQDRGPGYRQELAPLYEPADFDRLLPGIRIQHGPFKNISDYREYLKLMAAYNGQDPIRHVFLLAETQKMALHDGISAVVGRYPNTYAYQLNADKIEAEKSDGTMRTEWPVRTEFVSAVIGRVCILPSFINFYFFKEEPSQGYT